MPQSAKGKEKPIFTLQRAFLLFFGLTCGMLCYAKLAIKSICNLAAAIELPTTAGNIMSILLLNSLPEMKDP